MGSIPTMKKDASMKHTEQFGQKQRDIIVGEIVRLTNSGNDMFNYQEKPARCCWCSKIWTRLKIYSCVYAEGKTRTLTSWVSTFSRSIRTSTAHRKTRRMNRFLLCLQRNDAVRSNMQRHRWKSLIAQFLIKKRRMFSLCWSHLFDTYGDDMRTDYQENPAECFRVKIEKHPNRNMNTNSKTVNKWKTNPYARYGRNNWTR